MQKFSEFLNEYKNWKKETKGSSLLNTKEIKSVREAYSTLESKNASQKPMAERADGSKIASIFKGFAEYNKDKKCAGKDYNTEKTDSAFFDYLENYSKYKESKSGSKEVTLQERMALRKSFAQKGLKESNSKSLKDFSNYVLRFREWKKETHGTSHLTEAEKSALKAKFFNTPAKKLDETKVATKSAALASKVSKFDEAIKSYKEWKKVNKGTDLINETEKTEVIKNVYFDSIKSKLSEAKKSVREARKHMIEGDVMDAAAATQDAGVAVNAADGVAGQVQAGDANVPATPIPQNIIDEIAQIKSSVDALATEAGIQSPIDLGATPQAGIPATTGVADPNAMPAEQVPVDPNAVPQQMPESENIATIKSRLAEREEKLDEGKYVLDAEAKAIADNPNLSAPKSEVDKTVSDDLVKVPSTKELLSGTKKGPVAAGKVWPTEKITDPDEKKLGNIEENADSENAKRVAESLDDNGAFNWEKFLSANKGLYK